MSDTALPAPGLNLSADAAARLAAELMPVSVVAGGWGAAGLVAALAGAGLEAELLEGPSPAEPVFDLAIMLAATGATASPETRTLLAGLSAASDRLLFIPLAPADDAPTLPALTEWFELFADLGYQPVMDFDAGFVAPGSFLVDRSATAAESELDAFADRLTPSASQIATAASEPATPPKPAEPHPAIAELEARDRELAAVQGERSTLHAEAAALRAERDRLVSRVHDAEARAERAIRAESDMKAANAGWDALRLWVRTAVAQAPGAPPPQQRGFWARLFGGLPSAPGAHEEHDLAAIRASAHFDAAWYIASNPDLAQNAGDPARHYLTEGAANGADPGPYFDTAAYLREHPEARDNPLLHLIRSGER